MDKISEFRQDTPLIQPLPAPTGTMDDAKNGAIVSLSTLMGGKCVATPGANTFEHEINLQKWMYRFNQKS